MVVDRFSKYGVFILASEHCTTEVIIELFFQHTMKLFGLSEDIVNDRDAQSIGRFWTSLFKKMRSKLNFLTTNHLQTDDQTEQINVLVEDYLCHFVTASQRAWVKWLNVV